MSDSSNSFAAPQAVPHITLSDSSNSFAAPQAVPYITLSDSSDSFAAPQAVPHITLSDSSNSFVAPQVRPVGFDVVSRRIEPIRPEVIELTNDTTATLNDVNAALDVVRDGINSVLERRDMEEDTTEPANVQDIVAAEPVPPPLRRMPRRVVPMRLDDEMPGKNFRQREILSTLEDYCRNKNPKNTLRNLMEILQESVF